jgi:hypothetical protein
MKKAGCYSLCSSRLWVLAEQVGFEPTVRHNRTPDFESGAFDHSATAPDSVSRGAKPKILTDQGARRSTPPMYGRSASGTVTEPSAFW